MTNQPNEVYNPLAKRTSVRMWSMPCSVGRWLRSLPNPSLAQESTPSTTRVVFNPIIRLPKPIATADMQCRSTSARQFLLEHAKGDLG